MAMRFDDAPILGFLPQDGYIEIGNRDPQEIAGLILERLDAMGESIPAIDRVKPFGKLLGPIPPIPDRFFQRSTELKVLKKKLLSDTGNQIGIAATSPKFHRVSSRSSLQGSVSAGISTFVKYSVFVGGL